MGASPRGVDWDEDGDIDLISGENNGKVMLFENVSLSGNPIPDLTRVGYIQANNVDIDVGSLSVPLVDDWNEDGKKDLIVGSDTGYIYLYLNTGTNAAPLFTNQTRIEADGGAIYYRKNCPRIADLNEDGLKDLVVTGLEGACLFWPNYGTNAAPVFHEEYELSDYQVLVDPTPGGYNWCHFDVCDWNEDGHVDLLYTKWESEIKVYLHGNHHIGCLAEPINPPINIPAQGGSFSCRLTLSNGSAHDILLDAWTDAVLPNGALYGPVREKVGVTLPAGATWRFTIHEYVPGYVQTGLFSYNLCVGKMGSGCFVIGGFDFTKL